MDMDIVNIRHQIIFQLPSLYFQCSEITGGRKDYATPAFCIRFSETAAHNSSYWSTSGNTFIVFEEQKYLKALNSIRD